MRDSHSTPYLGRVPGARVGATMEELHEDRVSLKAAGEVMATPPEVVTPHLTEGTLLKLLSEDLPWTTF
jgi:hypothetical protein